MSGPNYMVGPTARSDGIMRIFEVDTTYGKFQFDGVEFTKMRLRELEAAAALEKMSQSEAWAESFGKAVVAPLKFGVDFSSIPSDAWPLGDRHLTTCSTGPSAGLATRKPTATPWPTACSASATHSASWPFELGVDPYTDFPPLAQRLQADGARHRRRPTDSEGRACRGHRRHRHRRFGRLERGGGEGHLARQDRGAGDC